MCSFALSRSSAGSIFSAPYTLLRTAALVAVGATIEAYMRRPPIPCTAEAAVLRDGSSRFFVTAFSKANIRSSIREAFSFDCSIVPSGCCLYWGFV